MPNTLQEFFAHATQKAADDLIAAIQRLPEGKRGWSPDEKARTALDQVAECALLNGYTADLIQTRQWAMNDFGIYYKDKAEAAALPWDKLEAMLQESTARLVGTIRAVPDDALQDEIEMPWQKQPLAEIVAYPHWNMTYHQGQINYIASILGCLG